MLECRNSNTLYDKKIITKYRRKKIKLINQNNYVLIINYLIITIQCPASTLSAQLSSFQPSSGARDTMMEMTQTRQIIRLMFWLLREWIYSARVTAQNLNKIELKLKLSSHFLQKISCYKPFFIFISSLERDRLNNVI